VQKYSFGLPTFCHFTPEERKKMKGELCHPFYFCENIVVLC